MTSWTIRYNENDTMIFLPLRSLLPYNWTTNNSKLFTVLDYLFEFLSWRDLARLTKVSKGFYSNIIVRCRQHFLHHDIREANVIIENDAPATAKLMITVADVDDCLSLNSSDELALYSSDCSRITSVSIPASFQDPPPAVVPNPNLNPTPTPTLTPTL